MTPIRNFEQIILVKRLYQDASDLSESGERLSLTKSIILLDLAVEQALKSILLNLNPDYLIPRGRNDIGWKDLWREASDAVQAAKGVHLAERNESSRLHELRNLVQHHGTEPPASEVRRYAVSTKRMLEEAFRDAFGLNFDDLRPWDFIENEDLRRLMNESEDFLRDGNPAMSIIGGKLARRLIVEAIHTFTTKSRSHHPSFPTYEARELIRAVPALSEFLSKFTEFLGDRIKGLETEIILVGLGMPIIDTRRFMQIRGVTGESMAGDGRLWVNITRDADREEETEAARFMLDYFYRLIRRVEEDHPGLLGDIKIKIPLSGQDIAKHSFRYK